MIAKRVVATVMFALAALTGVASAEMKEPKTVADHRALAQAYTEKAAAYKKEAAEHREMSEMYKKSVAPGGKAGPNPWAKKMEAHCMKIVKDAEAMADDAEFAARIHTLRAQELEGKSP